ncbi:MAG: hypothetical protein ACYTFF_20745 [Planctomycetota bacterium]
MAGETAAAGCPGIELTSMGIAVTGRAIVRRPPGEKRREAAGKLLGVRKAPALAVLGVALDTFLLVVRGIEGKARGAVKLSGHDGRVADEGGVLGIVTQAARVVTRDLARGGDTAYEGGPVRRAVAVGAPARLARDASAQGRNREPAALLVASLAGQPRVAARERKRSIVGELRYVIKRLRLPVAGRAVQPQGPLVGILVARGALLAQSQEPALVGLQRLRVRQGMALGARELLVAAGEVEPRDVSVVVSLGIGDVGRVEAEVRDEGEHLAGVLAVALAARRRRRLLQPAVQAVPGLDLPVDVVVAGVAGVGHGCAAVAVAGHAAGASLELLQVGVAGVQRAGRRELLRLPLGDADDDRQRHHGDQQAQEFHGPPPPASAAQSISANRTAVTM